MPSRQRICLAVAAAIVALGSQAAALGQDLVTVRLGEQESCKISGVTKYAAGKDGVSAIRFDVSRLPPSTAISRAVLRFWVYSGNQFSDAYKQWGFARWQKEGGFEGFKVFRGASPVGEPLDVKFPFNAATAWLMEFDVTPAVRAWVKDPNANDGLTMNFRVPVAPDDADPLKAWMRPYLQATYEGENRERPPQVTDLKAFYRSGQVFLTWGQKDQPVAFYDQTCRVYRHDKPITAANLHEATLLGEVHRNSQLNCRRSQMCIGWGHTGATNYYAGSLMLDGRLPLQEATHFGGGKPQGYVQAQPKRFNFVIDDAWADRRPDRVLTHVHADRPEWTKKQQATFRATGGPELSDDTGLFVHTVRKEVPAWFCVTAVLDGNENRRDISSGNSLVAAVACKVEEPKAVLQAVYNHAGPWGPAQLREYAYWEGGEGRFHNTASTPIVFTFGLPQGFVAAAGKPDPDRQAAGNTAWVRTSLHLAGYGNNYWQNSAGSGCVRMDTRHIPPTQYAPFPTAAAPGVEGWRDGYARYYHATRKAPDIPVEGAEAQGTVWQPTFAPATVFGYMSTWDTGADPRTGMVVPYIENRALFEIDAVLRDLPELSPQRIASSGEWNGMVLAIHHAERFAAAACTMEGPWTADRLKQDRAGLAGLPAWDLKTPSGHSVWKWNDLVWYSRQFPDREWPFLSHLLSVNYDGGGTYGNMGYPQFYLDLAKELRGGAWWWCDIGDAPDTDFPAIARDEAYPVLTNATCCQVPDADWKNEPRGTLNGFVEWSRPGRPFALPCDLGKVEKAEWKNPPEGRKHPYVSEHWKNRPDCWTAVALEPVDEPDCFELALHIRKEGRVLNGQSVPACPVLCGMVDITPRRLQRFNVAKGAGKRYVWRNVRVETGQLLQAGVVEPDEHGLLTVPRFFVDKDILGNKLILQPATGQDVPKPDAAQSIVIHYPDPADTQKLASIEYPYARYQAECAQPEMVKVVRDDRLFTPVDFTNGGPKAAHYSMWGGGWDDAFQFNQPGRYRVEIKTDKAYFQNGAWPQHRFAVEPLHQSLCHFDRPCEMTTYRWVDMAQAGRHRVALRIVNNTFHEPFKHGDAAGMTDRGVALVSVRFVHLPPRPEGNTKPFVVQANPRGASVAPGMPLRLSAQALDEWGQPCGEKARWSTSGGAAVSPEGVFAAAKEGVYTVTASAGEATDAAVITVQGDAWTESFNGQWPDGWNAAPAPTPSRGGEGERGRDGCPSLTSRWWVLELSPAKDAKGPCMTWYEPGVAWTDYSFQADLAADGGNYGLAPIRSLLVRFVDEKNHYRFDETAGKGTASWRLVKVVGGQETELATAQGAAPPPTEMTGEQALSLTMSKWAFVKDDRRYRSEYFNSVEEKQRQSIDAADARCWKDREDRTRAELAKQPLRTMRYCVEAKGERIVCRVNGQEVLSASDGALKSGTVGFRCQQGGVRWDDLIVRPLR